MEIEKERTEEMLQRDSFLICQQFKYKVTQNTKSIKCTEKYDLERYTHTDLIFSVFYLKVLSSHVLFRNITKYHGNDNYTAVIAHYDVLYIDFKRTIIRTITKELLFSSKLICNSQTSKFKIYTCTDNHSLDAIP